MHLRILSDLHVEFHDDSGAGLIEGLEPTGADLLVVAGDLAPARLLPDALTRLCDRFEAVLYVVGNHDYYHCAPPLVHDILATTADRLCNLHWLHHEVRRIGDLVFAGTPLWFPERPEADHAHRWLNDFRLIRHFEPWVYEENRRALDLLSGPADQADVVVTHHLPSQESVAARYRGSPLNPFFVCDVEHLVGRGRQQLWIHGHTHDFCDHFIGRTRIVCNALGYPDEDGPRGRTDFGLDVQPAAAAPDPTAGRSLEDDPPPTRPG